MTKHIQNKVELFRRNLISKSEPIGRSNSPELKRLIHLIGRVNVEIIRLQRKHKFGRFGEN
jgi:hypothetical protein